MDTIEHNGMIFTHYNFCMNNIEATATFENKRIVHHGNFQITEKKGCLRWGDQFIISVWSQNSPKIEECVVTPKKWKTIEIYLTRDEFEKVILSMAEKIKNGVKQ